MTTPIENPVLREAVAYHEAFRKLGYSADDIFFATWPGGEAQVILRVGSFPRGACEFSCDCGNIGMSQEAARVAWEAACEAWNTTMTAEERAALWDESTARREAVMLVFAMAAKGFDVSGGKKLGGSL